MMAIKYEYNEVRVILNQREMQVLEDLVESEIPTTFTDPTSFIELALVDAGEYLERYHGAIKLGNTG